MATASYSLPKVMLCFVASLHKGGGGGGRGRCNEMRENLRLAQKFSMSGLLKTRIKWSVEYEPCRPGNNRY